MPKPKSNVIFLLSFVLLAIGLSAVFVLTNQKSQHQNQNTIQTTPIQENPNDKTSVTSGNYVSYESGLLEKNTDKKRVLFFYANWCPTCRPSDVNFQNNSDKIPSDVLLVRVNYEDSDTDEEERQLANEYSVTYQHTFVQIDSLGKEVTKWNGGQINELLARIK